MMKPQAKEGSAEMWRLRRSPGPTLPPYEVHLHDDNGRLCWSGTDLAEAFAFLAVSDQESVEIGVADALTLFNIWGEV